MTRPEFRLLPAGLLLALIASPLAAQVSTDREVEDLAFRGNATFSDDELAHAIATSESRCKSLILQPFCWVTDWGFAHSREYLDEAALPADLLRLRIFYRRRGFRDVEVDTAVNRTDGSVRIRFEIREGTPTRVSSVDVTGLAPPLDEAAVRARFPLEPGERFDLVQLEQGKVRVVEWLRNRGYADAAVLDEYFIPAGERDARLTLDVRPGTRKRIGEVRVEGGGDLGEGVVRQVLTFREGQWFDQSRLLESQRALYRLDAIRFANVQTETGGASDSLLAVVVDVTPAPERTVRAGIGATTAECAQTEVRFTHRNFLGGARRLQLTGQLSNIFARQLAGSFPCTTVGEDSVFQDLNFTLRADLQLPFFFSPRNRLEAALFLERETVPEIFVRSSRGGEVSVTRRLRSNMPLSLTWRPELTRFDERSADIFFCVNFGFCQPEDIDVLTQSRWLSPLTVNWSYDRTNAPFSPTSGYYVNMNLEGAQAVTGSDYQYARFNVEAANFERLTGGLVLGTRFRAGFVEALGGQPFGPAEPGETVIHPRKRFFAGGAQSVRGIGQNLLGPTVLVMSASRCGDLLGGGFTPTRPDLIRCARTAAASDTLDPEAFFDERPAGGDAAFEANFELRAGLGSSWTWVGFVDVGQVWVDIGELEPPVVTPGMGIRYSSPVGPLRLDVGYDPTSPEDVPVVAELQTGEIEELGQSVQFDTFGYDEPAAFTEFVRRLRLHISIGQAF